MIPFQRLENHTSSCISCQAKAREAASAPGTRVLLLAAGTEAAQGSKQDLKGHVNPWLH